MKLIFRGTARLGRQIDKTLAREPVCRACEWLLGETCRHPSRSCGCPTNAVRVHPWRKQRACPAEKWGEGGK